LDHAAPQELTLESVYDAWFQEVTRWIRALGGFECEVEDLAQEVFLVVERQLHHFEGGNLGGWLYRITANIVRDRRQRAWVRRVLFRQARPQLDALQGVSRSPAELLEEKEVRRSLYALLDQLSDKRRSVYILFEIEGYSGEEIAALQEIPVATVWTRLHHARRHLSALALRQQERQR
jgi:RNA polymerase sigma-70 factor (ECF subfamily)